MIALSLRRFNLFLRAERPVRVLWEDKRGPVIRRGVSKRTWGTFRSRAESLRAERAPLCEKSHAVSAFRESHAFGRHFKPASMDHWQTRRHSY
jgi:hypothetical protein